MSRKDISDHQVCQAYNDRHDLAVRLYPTELLAARTGQPEKVCYRAMERAYDRGLIECGVSLDCGWLTDAGKALLGAPDQVNVVQQVCKRITEEYAASDAEFKVVHMREPTSEEAAAMEAFCRLLNSPPPSA